MLVISAIVDPEVAPTLAELVLSLLDFASADLSRFVLLPPGSDLEGEPFCFFFGPMWAATCLNSKKISLQFNTH